ncbi:hypothetical protein GCM10009747_15520 [Agromyces humatus]|uniref:LPXTG cell wall anchor domain-containing protein n=1 Tax=Agromyces humatus TaxID=279573 RepID=A0ABP4WRL3_9MICO
MTWRLLARWIETSDLVPACHRSDANQPVPAPPVVLFDAGAGNPYIEWPTLAESTVILALAGPGLVLAFLLTARSRKVP